jgi:predicted O-methyltransferase YrrM
MNEALEGLKETQQLPLFSQDWFSRSIPCWDLILKQMRQNHEDLKVLDIGVFEGRSTCWLLQNHCHTKASKITVIDTFTGGVEHQKMDLKGLRGVFEQNIGCVESHAEVEILEGDSLKELAGLVASGREDPGYDFISVDASHQATDVLADCTLAFRLLRQGGVMALDDYLWSAERPGTENPLNDPKIAIDAFTTIFRRKIRIIPNLPLYQLYLQKL